MLPLMALVGGFLGAGKTTFIGRVVGLLQSRGLRCAVVSNDQSVGLVDTASARLLAGAAVGEVTGACFCCKLEEKGMEVAHFKAALAARQKTRRQKTEDQNALADGDGGGGEVAIVNQVLSGEEPGLSRRMEGMMTAGELLVNLRAEGDAGDLKAIVREVLEGDARVALVWHDEAAFQPGEPKPTHRMTSEGDGASGSLGIDH